ncbi:hypothetical protein [Robbsia andropogonis]|nr:hypothetical protein [Robbsia andropogonis]
MVDRYDDIIARVHGPSGKSVSYEDYAAMEDERDAIAAELKSANSRLHEVAIACATAEQERDALAEQIPKWQPIETAPKDTIARLLGYRNDLGNWRTVRGRYYSQEEIDDYWEYPEDAAPGWYETPVNADEPPNVWLVTPTHWMPLPRAPKEQS